MLLKKKQNKTISPLNLIIEELKDGFCTIDEAGDFLYSNRAMREMLQLKSSFEDLNFYRNIIKSNEHINNIKNYLSDNGYIKDYELELHQTNGNKILVLLTMNHLRSPENKVIATSVLIKDITEIKKVQNQLLQAQKMESLGMLASGIAHEFNNILTGIIPNAELIRINTKDGDSNNLRAKSIHKSALRAADIVRELLSFARNEKRRTAKHTNFYKNASETVDILEKLFSKRIKINSNFPQNSYYIKLDETRLQQILMNLAINAKDAIKGEGQIFLSAENIEISNNESKLENLEAGKYLKFSIADTGHGIKKEVIEKIFNPFFTTKEPGKGTGLGLSIVYNIVKNMKGKIEVESSINKGTKFIIYFPAVLPEKDELESSNKVQKQNALKTVLVIDDEPLIREMASDMLLTIGYKVFVASNGEEGVNFFVQRKEDIDLILLDLMMPGMNGIVCLEKLKKIDNNIKVIITSGLNDLHQKQKLIQLGVDGYLEKPFSLKNMSDTIRAAFSY